MPERKEFGLEKFSLTCSMERLTRQLSIVIIKVALVFQKIWCFKIDQKTLKWSTISSEILYRGALWSCNTSRTDEQMADILTKPLTSTKFVYSRDKLGMTENTSLAKRECWFFLSSIESHSLREWRHLVSYQEFDPVWDWGTQPGVEGHSPGEWRHLVSYQEIDPV